MSIRQAPLGFATVKAPLVNLRLKCRTARYAQIGSTPPLSALPSPRNLGNKSLRFTARTCWSEQLSLSPLPSAKCLHVTPPFCLGKRHGAPQDLRMNRERFAGPDERLVKPQPPCTVGFSNRMPKADEVEGIEGPDQKVEIC